ncbi:MAG: hypothetical protein ACYDH9_20290 [Limisphaerales bacterium]
MTELPPKNLLLAVTVLGGSLLLLILVVQDFGSSFPQSPPLAASRSPMPPSLADGAFLDLFSPGTLARMKAGTNTPNPFYTTYFQPPPPPAPKTTRKIELTYQGFQETTGGDKRAYLLVGTNLVVRPVGGTVIADLTVVDIALKALILKHNGTQEVVLSFSAKKDVEIPVE